MISDVENYRPGVVIESGRALADMAFARAIRDGRLSSDPAAANYAGQYMFMGRSADAKRDSFKHRDSREYLP